LSFTAEEIWRFIPGGRGTSIFLETWHDDLPALAGDAPLGAEFWERIIAVREAVGKQLERLRVAGGIGSALDAEVDLYCDGSLRDDLAQLADELRFVLITSDARVQPSSERPDNAVIATVQGQSIWIDVSPCGHPKCKRCWHHRYDVGTHAAHPELCARCIENVDGAGEHRRFA
jgi:isoleucyl-tRNA synthetase